MHKRAWRPFGLPSGFSSRDDKNGARHAPQRLPESPASPASQFQVVGQGDISPGLRSRHSPVPLALWHCGFALSHRYPSDAGDTGLSRPDRRQGLWPARAAAGNLCVPVLLPGWKDVEPPLPSHGRHPLCANLVGRGGRCSFDAGFTDTARHHRRGALRMGAPRRPRQPGLSAGQRHDPDA
ncbi:hypothetical protein D3C71_1405510 [compost metagenome]